MEASAQVDSDARNIRPAACATTAPCERAAIRMLRHAGLEGQGYMALNFPNVSRSYDASRKCVRFWGHDGTFEIAFLLDLEALSKLHELPRSGEAAILSAFDRCRSRIISVAAALYRRHRSSTYRLVAADF